MILAVTFFLFQNQECHEEQAEEQVREGNENAGGDEEQKREQARNPE